MKTIDLNADLGEGFGHWRMGDDDAMLDFVTSANIACGFHAGDPDIMSRCFALAKEKNVAIGAHVAFQDLIGFGRRLIPLSPTEITHAVCYQIGAAQALARLNGARVSYVKAHGALANSAEINSSVAEAIAQATKLSDASLSLLSIALSEQTHAGYRSGLQIAHEVFADRAYSDDGRLLPRQHPEAIISDINQIIDRMSIMLECQSLLTIGGKKLPTKIDSICVHGDTPQAINIAQCLRASLLGNGYSLRAFSQPAS